MHTSKYLFYYLDCTVVILNHNKKIKCTTIRFFRIKPITATLEPLSFDASSWFDETTAPQYAQLYSEENGYWKPSKTNENEYLQIYLGYPETVYGVEVSGNPINDEYVTSYKVAYSLDGISYSYVLYHGQPEVIFKLYLYDINQMYYKHRVNL